ncbi:MAG: hypothetical protein QOJ13_1044 [Gaiellales bacterium]|jgi:hypothetical protein|nr:hypothetical protein [Gaiellales bacterium]
MGRIHTYIIVIALGMAVVAGTYAALQTAALGQESSTANEQQIKVRERALDQAEAKLRKAAKQRPPKLPALPKDEQPTGSSSVRVTTTVSQATSSHSSGDDDDRDDTEGGDD